MPLITTADFANNCGASAMPLGTHTLRGFEDDVTLVTYPLR